MRSRAGDGGRQKVSEKTTANGGKQQRRKKNAKEEKTYHIKFETQMIVASSFEADEQIKYHIHTYRGFVDGLSLFLFGVCALSALQIVSNMWYLYGTDQLS